MTLRVEFVSRLSDIITPAIEFLREPADLFAGVENGADTYFAALLSH